MLIDRPRRQEDRRAARVERGHPGPGDLLQAQHAVVRFTHAANLPSPPRAHGAGRILSSATLPLGVAERNAGEEGDNLAKRSSIFAGIGCGGPSLPHVLGI